MALAEILAETEPGKFSDALVDWAIDPNLGGLDDADLKSAPPLIKAAIYIRAFHMAAVNDGIYIWFNELPEDDADLAQFLKIVHAKRAAAYFRDALKLFPGQRIPDDPDERFEICDRHERELNALDKRHAGAAEDAVLRLRDYVARHKGEFEEQVQQFWKRRRRRAQR
jgi:hypothetical protein